MTNKKTSAVKQALTALTLIFISTFTIAQETMTPHEELLLTMERLEQRLDESIAASLSLQDLADTITARLDKEGK